MVRLVLLRLLESYFRHRWLYLLPIVIMVATAGYSMATAKPRFSSGGVMYVQGESLVSTLNDLPRDGAAWWMSPSQVAANEITELLQTEAFVRSLVRGTPLESQMAGSPEQVGEAINIVNERVWVITAGENLIRFGADYEAPEVAFQLANQLTESYILWKLNSDRQDSITAQQFFNELIAPYQADLDQARQNLEDYLQQYPAPIRGDRPEVEQLEIDRLQAEVVKADSRVQDLIQKEESARLAQVQAERNLRQTYLMIDAPRQPNLPSSGLRSLALENSIFIVVGVILTVLGIIGGAVLDRSLRFPLDATQWLHLPVLAMTPPNHLRRGKITRMPARDGESRAEEAALSKQALSGSVAPSTRD